MASDQVLKPGWLKKDMERASQRVDVWKAEGTKPIVPVFSNSTQIKAQGVNKTNKTE